jgi:hypothetical protein
MSLYGYGTNFIGGAEYPKVKRGIVYDQPEKWAKAAIINADAVQENPWVKHLRESGVYKQVKNLLRQARATYQPVNPANKRKNLQRQLNRIQKIYELFNPEYPEIKQEYYFKTPYEKAKAAAFGRLIKQANKLGQELGVKVELSKPTVPIPPEMLQVSNHIVPYYAIYLRATV